ncbi:mechanosensitive ion channel family protein [Paenibacillus thiaminolyticus]|uniref:Mechanosensitive ion channel family protein n=2 Tax=Paenibacillus thiaminolyticus TaxID=49283 RepID=A0A3A3GKB8_PANTH|nr:mechanosensitive ion channel family protein [Paenibacillus thiaminolyticus]
MLNEWIPGMLETMDWSRWLSAAGVLLLFLLFRKLFTNYLFALLMRGLSRSKGATHFLAAFEKPMQLFFVLIGIYLACKMVIPPGGALLPAIDKIYRNVFIVLVAWGLYHAAARSSSIFSGLSARLGLDESSMLIPFLSKVLRFLVVVIALTMIASEWGYSINGVVAGLGLGSLAIALAAQDTLSNFLGGIVIITEKPFSKGDWIMTPSVEGTVEDITFRSSKIRTFAHSLVTVPNATLAGQAITNWSRMGKRRVTFTLNVALDSDRERLQAAIAQMDARLRENEAVDPDVIMVRFSEFNESSLGIFFYYFTKTTVWAEYLQHKEQINLMIMEVLEEEGISLALPSQRLYVEAAPSPQRFPL